MYVTVLREVRIIKEFLYYVVYIIYTHYTVMYMVSF